jgi:hypothetical protein
VTLRRDSMSVNSALSPWVSSANRTSDLQQGSDRQHLTDQALTVTAVSETA